MHDLIHCVNPTIKFKSIHEKYIEILISSKAVYTAFSHKIEITSISRKLNKFPSK